MSGSGVVNQSGGQNTWTNNGYSGYLHLGYYAGATGQYNLSAGTLAIEYETVGDQGTGTFAQSGGTNVATQVTLAGYAGSNASYTLSGIGGLSAGTENVGLYGTGTFNQYAGTNTAGLIAIASNSGAYGAYNLSGGTLIVSSLIQGAGVAAFNFSGGLLRAGSSFSTSLPMTLGAGGGATFDTAGFALTLAGSLSGPGSLAVIGSGSLTLTAPSAYVGSTIITGATLQLADDANGNFPSLASSGIINNGTLAFDTG